MAMLSITDSRVQGDLIREAKDAGKLAEDYEIPDAHRENFPERIAEALKPAHQAGLLPAFPFGSDFTDAEQALIPALQRLRDASPVELAKLAARGVFSGDAAPHEPALARLGLEKPKSISDRLYRALVSGALSER